MLDTNICIFLLNKKSSSLIEKIERFDRGSLVMSSVTLFELFYGIGKSQRKQVNFNALQALLTSIIPLDFCSEAAKEAGLIRSTLSELGTPIGPYDTLIAGHAISQNLPLVSYNLNEFKRVKKLSLEYWN